MCFNVIHEINESYSIIDNNFFYNDGISKNLNLARDFRTFVRNERIKKKKKKEENKNNNDNNNNGNNTNKLDINKKIQEEKEKNKIELDDDEDPDEEEEEEKSRSTSILMAYLIKYKNENTNSAYKILKAKRKLTMPNLGFMYKLREYEKKCNNYFQLNDH